MIDPRLGYLAGMIDADGCIGIYRRSTYYVPSVKITNTRLSIIEHCQEILDEYECTYWISSREKGGNRKTQYDIIIEGRERCKKVLLLIHSLLAGKKDQATAVLRMCDIDGRTHGMDNIIELHEEVRDLNSQTREGRVK